MYLVTLTKYSRWAILQKGPAMIWRHKLWRGAENWSCL